MKMRPPATPLITSDPFFSVWSETDALNASDTVHWTGRTIALRCTVKVGDRVYGVMGRNEGTLAARQVGSDMDAFSSYYTFDCDGVKVRLTFTSPVIPDDMYLISRPVSYLLVSADAAGVSAKVSVSEQICLDLAGEYPVKASVEGGSVTLASEVQNVLSRDGDDQRIDWGKFYLTCKGAEYGSCLSDGMTFVFAEAPVGEGTLFSFAYDDVKSIEYFGDKLDAYWKTKDATIADAICAAHRDYPEVMKRCADFSAKMVAEATEAGGEKYAELLILSLRQSVAAHKLVLDTNGEVLYISKECFSNGCAATVDVSYPSTPLFLLYNPELVRGMMRPIYRFAATDAWQYDFAPHDAGRYPRVNGQVYGLKDGVLLEAKQMPLEECGNMLVMEATAAVATGNADFAAEHLDVLRKWCAYLEENGDDPANQLCTDDFAGHLAHNCNLTLKAIMGIAGMGIIEKMLGNDGEYERLLAHAKKMAQSWITRAANADGSYRLAFNWQNSFSMKYNIAWDKLLGTGIMPKEVLASEFASYAKHMNNYGLPLDNRADYTKSDWYIWTGVLADSREEFGKFIEPLWNSYNETESREPMTDWYMTTTALHRSYGSSSGLVKSFRNRTVVGGHFMKLLEYRGTLDLGGKAL